MHRSIASMFLGACLTLALMSVAPAAEYEMKDLEVLDREGSWQELVEHLKDIPPSKRDRSWHAMAERACTNHLASIPQSDERPTQALVLADALLERFPLLRSSRTFMGKRAEVGLASFKYTFGQFSHRAGDDKWLDMLLAFAHSDRVTPDLALRAGKLIMGRLVPETAVPLFKLALGAQGGQAHCRDADVQKALLAALGDGLWKDDIRDLVGNRCWNELRGPALAAFDKPPSADYRKNACPLLKAKKALSAVQEGACAAP